MKILRLRAYYDPEKTAGIHLDHDLCEAFKNNGIHYISYTPSPTRGVSKEVREEYKKKRNETLYDGFVTINRFPMFPEGRNPIQRAIRYAACSIREYQLGTKEKDIDLVYSSSTPPTQGMLSALVAKRLSKKYDKKVPFVYNLQDIFPDSLVNAKMTKKGSLIWKIGRKIEDYTYHSADKIIVISEGFKRNIMEKGVPEEKIVVIPNWVDTESVYPVDRKDNILFDRYNLDRDKFYICYSGNLGHSQNLELLLEAAKQLKTELPDVSFVLIGEGAAKGELEKEVAEEQLDNIIILPFQPYEDIAHVFSLGDVGLIISKPGIGGSSVPSKTWSIMAAERPVLASFDEDSEVNAIVKQLNCGICSNAGELNTFCTVICTLYENRTFAKEMGKSGRNYVCRELNKGHCTRKYIDVIEATPEIFMQ